MEAVNDTAAVRLPARPGGNLPASLERRVDDQELRALARHGTAEDMADLLLMVSEPARRALASSIEALAFPAGMPASSVRWEAVLLVAGAGCLPDADAVVSW